MNKKIYFFISLLFLTTAIHKTAHCWDFYSLDKNLFVGNILFPQTIKTVPQVLLYQRGIKLQTETDDSSKKIQFTVTEERKCKKIHFLVTQYVQPNIEKNIVTGLKIGRKQDYKLYKLRLIEKRNTQKSDSEKNNTSYHWQIEEKKLAPERRIPDDTLIVIFNPNYIEKIDEGSSFELPKIWIRPDILELAGSEEKLHDEVNELLMASLDLNILHSKPTSEIKPNHKKKLVIAMSNPE